MGPAPWQALGRGREAGEGQGQDSCPRPSDPKATARPSGGLPAQGVGRIQPALTGESRLAGTSHPCHLRPWHPARLRARKPPAPGPEPWGHQERQVRLGDLPCTACLRWARQRPARAWGQGGTHPAPCQPLRWDEGPWGWWRAQPLGRSRSPRPLFGHLQEGCGPTWPDVTDTATCPALSPVPCPCPISASRWDLRVTCPWHPGQPITSATCPGHGWPFEPWPGWPQLGLPVGSQQAPPLPQSPGVTVPSPAVPREAGSPSSFAASWTLRRTLATPMTGGPATAGPASS